MKITLNSNNLYDYLFNVFYTSKKSNFFAKIEFKQGNSWLVTLQNQQKIMIKQKHYLDIYNTTNSSINEYIFYNFIIESCDKSLQNLPLALKILHFDLANSIAIYKYPEKYIELESFNIIEDISLSIKIARCIGKALASIHIKSRGNQTLHKFINKEFDSKIYNHFPYSIYLQDQIKSDLFFQLPPETYNFLALYQKSPNLQTAIKKLISNNNNLCLTNNKLSNTNILISEQLSTRLYQKNNHNVNLIKFINWENSCWGDPASDMGSAIASYLLIWINSMIVHPDIKLEQSLALAKIPLKSVQPLIVALTQAYLSEFKEILELQPNFLQRVIQFTGLSLIHNILEDLNSFKGWNNHSLCQLQLSKNLLCKPEQSFISVFGITASELLQSLNCMICTSLPS